MCLEDEVKSLGRECGADLVGVASVDRFDGAPPGRHPQNLLPEARVVVVYGFNLLESCFAYTKRVQYSMMYTRLRMMGELTSYRIARFLEGKGYFAVVVPGSIPMDLEGKLTWGDISLTHAAAAAGLGEIGRNHLFLSPQFGPRQILGATITSAPLNPDTPFEGKLCLEDKCNLCVDNCMSGALSPDGMERLKCVKRRGASAVYALMKHMTQIIEEPDLEEKKKLIWSPLVWEVWQHMTYGNPGGPGECYNCLRLCPVGRKLPAPVTIKRDKKLRIKDRSLLGL
jgi:epoxyqueuosine reductase